MCQGAVGVGPRGRQGSARANCGGPVVRCRGAVLVSRGRRPSALRATSSEVMKATMLAKYPHYRYQEMLDFSNVYLFFWKW